MAGRETAFLPLTSLMSMLLLMPTAAFSLTVGNASALLLALSDASVDRIDVLPGHYLLNHELVVSRSLTVAAAEGGVVTLDGGLDMGERRRRYRFPPANSHRLLVIGKDATVNLVGILLTRGFLKHCHAFGDNFKGSLQSCSGGAIVNHGDLSMTNCSITHSYASYGGAIANYGNLAMTRCTIAHNEAGRGGGLQISAGTATLDACEMQSNEATAYGGAVCAKGGATVTITNSVMRHNKAQYGADYYAFDAEVTLQSTQSYDNHHGWIHPAIFGSATLVITLICIWHRCHVQRQTSKRRKGLIQHFWDRTVQDETSLGSPSRRNSFITIVYEKNSPRARVHSNAEATEAVRDLVAANRDRSTTLP